MGTQVTPVLGAVTPQWPGIHGLSASDPIFSFYTFSAATCLIVNVGPEGCAIVSGYSHDPVKKELYSSAAWLTSATSWNMSLEPIRNNSRVNIAESQAMREEWGGESQETKTPKGWEGTGVAKIAGLSRKEQLEEGQASQVSGLEKFRVRSRVSQSGGQ